MSFTIRNYPSDERYDLGKFLNFQIDVYDVINSPFLRGLKALPINEYYDVNSGYKDLDLISAHKYKSPYYAYYIMYYNDLTTLTVPENTTLNLFALTDLDNLVYNLSNGIIS